VKFSVPIALPGGQTNRRPVTALKVSGISGLAAAEWRHQAAFLRGIVMSKPATATNYTVSIPTLRVRLVIFGVLGALLLANTLAGRHISKNLQAVAYVVLMCAFCIAAVVFALRSRRRTGDHRSSPRATPVDVGLASTLSVYLLSALATHNFALLGHSAMTIALMSVTVAYVVLGFLGVGPR
jgi:hypothetical protein